MPYLTVSEVAERLGVSSRQLYDLVRRGLLPTVRVGRLIRVDPAALDAWIRAGGAAIPAAREP